MIWLSWRQSRLELLLTVAIGLCLASAIAITTVQMQSAFSAVQRACASTSGPLCISASEDFGSRFTTMSIGFEGAMLALPGLAGVFIGAPLFAREFEQGTARLVWTQGITRRRWLATKLGLILGVSAGVAGVLGLVGSFATGASTGMFASRWIAFDFQAPVLVAYVVFAIVLGSAAGAVIRRSVPAMAVTPVAFVAVRVAVFGFLRRQYLPPLEIDEIKLTDADRTNWNVGQRLVDLSGHPVSDKYYQQLMASARGMTGTLDDYFRAHGVVTIQLYQPESRFWLFQSMEAGLFVALAAALIVLLIWSIRRA
jgi:ABC-type transport system involved in multi-copper enzyme maturation permease subunit